MIKYIILERLHEFFALPSNPMVLKVQNLDNHELEKAFLRRRPKRPSMKVSGKSVFHLQRVISKQDTTKKPKRRSR